MAEMQAKLKKLRELHGSGCEGGEDDNRDEGDDLAPLPPPPLSDKTARLIGEYQKKETKCCGENLYTVITEHLL